MPVIRLEYDKDVVTEPDVQSLCLAVQKIVADATGIKEAFVYGNASQITVEIAPVEIWVELSANKVENGDVLAKSIREGLSEWKKEANFPHLINLTLIPMHWKLELDI